MSKRSNRNVPTRISTDAKAAKHEGPFKDLAVRQMQAKENKERIERLLGKMGKAKDPDRNGT